MKIRTLALCFMAFTQAFSAEILKWRSKDGHRFEASIVSKDATHVTLKGTDGKTVVVPLNVLDKKSLSQLENPGKNRPANPPVFSYESTFYRYKIYPRQDWIHLEFLEDGKPVNRDPYVLRVGFGESIDRRWKGYKITGMVGQPVENRDEVELKFATEKGTIHLFVGKKDSKAFTFHFALDRFASKDDSLLLRNSLSYKPMLKYHADSEKYKGPFSRSGYTFAELAAALKDYHIESITEKKSKKIEYSSKMRGAIVAEKFIITHPKDRVLTIDKGKSPGTLNIWLYGGKAPIEGYDIRFNAEKKGVYKAGPFSLELQ